MTPEEAWRDLALVPPAELVDPTRELHWAVQYIASAGQTWVRERADDSHRAMRWHHGLEAFVGEGFTEGYGFRVAVRPGDMTLHLVDGTDALLGTLSLPGMILSDGFEWLRLGLRQYMGQPPPPMTPPEYELPRHPLGTGGRFATDRGLAWKALAALYAAAAELLEEVAGARDDASTVRCWPHHFDIATLFTVDPGRGEEPPRTVGVGMAPAGHGRETWYWYVTPWPAPDPDALPDLPGAGRWHTAGWVGAVLPGTKVVAWPAEERRARVRDFIGEALEGSTRALGL